jgi:hypothetical protein
MTTGVAGILIVAARTGGSGGAARSISSFRR